MKFQPSVRVVTLAALVVAVSTSALAPMRATAGELFAYRSEAGRFSVDLPGESPSVRELSGSKFSITSNDVQHTAFVGDTEFAVEIHDIPRVAKLLLSSDYILERSRQRVCSRILVVARSILWRPLSRESPRARSGSRSRIENSRAELLLVLAGRRLYLVTVQHPRIDRTSRAAIAPFFESFSFWLE